ncbi:histone-lysine N-methyltransferase SETMAR [Trichonephila clavipes]|nr:histone-lysine N-methyltransferase SETMAR [Trichonephila clavipes]
MQHHIATLVLECLQHPCYSPDLAPSDFHLFPALKKNLAGMHFGSNAEGKQAVKRFFLMPYIQSPELFLDDFLKLIKRNMASKNTEWKETVLEEWSKIYMTVLGKSLPL